ncbi:hypothetical protein [Burkholderia sp. 22313]|uniref:hypothetical protein n=1 Tax=Burkholderia sp. 22313 TaxID=3453908 RepID=UPI003F873FE2
MDCVSALANCIRLAARKPGMRSRVGIARSRAAQIKREKKTPGGKATVVAFINACNKMVVALRSYKAQNVKGGLGCGGQLQVN